MNVMSEILKSGFELRMYATSVQKNVGETCHKSSEQIHFESSVTALQLVCQESSIPLDQEGHTNAGSGRMCMSCSVGQAPG